MSICIVTNNRNNSMFSNNLVAANKILGNNICMFVLDYHKSVQTER